MRGLLFAGLAACSYSPPQTNNPADDAPRGGSEMSIDAVGDAAVADVAIDAPFDPATDCPAGYNLVIGDLPSRYRVIPFNADWPTHHADCADDLIGKTHLIVFDTAKEIQLLGTQPTSRFLVGHFQIANQPAVGDNWLTVTGEPIDQTLWLGGQPNDNDFSEDGEQDRAFVNYPNGAGVQDGPASFATNGMCECDGKPIPPAIAAML
jgi:hypothetical protein